MSRWFRFYDDALNDPKILKLSDKEHRVWIALLCVASKNDGVFPSLEDVALLVRIKPEKLRSIIDSLSAAGLIDNDGAVSSPHNWNARQYKSDVSTARVKRFRNGKRSVSETPPETETEQKGGGGSAREPLISREAIEIAEHVASIAGYPDPKDWPKEWCGSPYRVEALLAQGWTRADFDAGARAAMKGRTEPPFSFKFFEGPVSRAFATRTAPVPVGKPETPYAATRQRSSLTNILDSAIADAEEAERRDAQGGQDPVRLLSHGGR